MTPWTAAHVPDQSGRTVVITGANSGIGLEAARALSSKGAHVILAVRDTRKGEAAARTLPTPAEVRHLDLADLDTVHAFADDLGTTDIDVLIANAGVMHVPFSRTAQGFEMQFGTNHLGHFALTNRLLPHITDRVVVLSSLTHRYGRIDFADLNGERGYRASRAYSQSKLANLLFTAELQRRLDEVHSHLRVLAAHPGWAATNLQTRTETRLGDLLGRIGNRVFAQSAVQGAEPTLFAATQDLPGNAYIGPDGLGEARGHPRPVGRSKAATDLAVARRLWEVSESLTRVTFPERILRSGSVH
jgi:NAD(P)-dependent dehydrogenase (short-subunit alcohol dehydrogenase family)